MDLTGGRLVVLLYHCGSRCIGVEAVTGFAGPYVVSALGVPLSSYSSVWALSDMLLETGKSYGELNIGPERK